MTNSCCNGGTCGVSNNSNAQSSCVLPVKKITEVAKMVTDERPVLLQDLNVIVENDGAVQRLSIKDISNEAGIIKYFGTGTASTSGGVVFSVGAYDDYELTNAQVQECTQQSGGLWQMSLNKATNLVEARVDKINGGADSKLYQVYVKAINTSASVGIRIMLEFTHKSQLNRWN